MPKDDWEKARRNDIARKAKAPDPKPLTQKQMQQRRERREPYRKPTQIAARFSQNSVLWFGKHKETPIKDVPLNYLKWLVAQPTADTPNMKRLQLFLKRYIKKQAGPVPQPTSALTKAPGPSAALDDRAPKATPAAKQGRSGVPQRHSSRGTNQTSGSA